MLLLSRVYTDVSACRLYPGRGALRCQLFCDWRPLDSEITCDWT